MVLSPSWQEVLDEYAEKENEQLKPKLESNENNTEKTDLQLSERHTDIVETIMKIIMETRVEMIGIEEDDLKHAATNASRT